jgi:hypothetical protein
MARNRKLIEFPKDEQDDFKATLLRWRLDDSDFEVTALEQDPPTDGGPIESTVTVVCRSNGKSEHFRAGHVSHWVIDFEHAVRARVFG